MWNLFHELDKIFLRSTSEKYCKILSHEPNEKRLFDSLVLNIEFTSRVRQDFSYFH